MCAPHLTFLKNYSKKADNLGIMVYNKINSKGG